MKKEIFALFLLCIGRSAFGQNADTLSPVALRSVVVTAYKEKPERETSLVLTALKTDSLNRYGNYNLNDMMARVPGVSMLSTGVAIAKPVVRGLYGNRLLVLISGLKFDNQQWQEEHGLGLSDVGLSRLELIKGPMSVLYGSEAIGGIINVIEEDKPATDTRESDIGLRFNSNTLGGLLEAGMKASRGNHWWRIRAAVENNADYADGNGNRVLNSRFKGYTLKGTFGFQRGNWRSVNQWMSSFNQFGFIFNDVYTFISPDARWSRKMDVNPEHLVLLNMLSSENKFRLKNSKLDLNIGLQSNERLENEGGGAISLNMHLITTQYLLKWEKQLSARNRLVLSNLGSFEDNTNYGSRKIVPDANMQESNISAFLETSIRRNLILENGAGIGEKYIKTYFTASVNGPEKDIHPFTKFSPYYNFFTGLTYFPGADFNIKWNAATGVRIPNLAELSSNGLHEGVFTYEIGDPSLKNEQNLALNLLLHYRFKNLEFSATPFYNYFFNYVYLTPTGEDWFGFPVYRYKQQNAAQYGAELRLGWQPFERLDAGVAYSGMRSKTADGDYTPYTPAQKITPSLAYTFDWGRLKSVYVYTDVDYCYAQNEVAPHEIATPAYALWNVVISTAFDAGGQHYTLGLAGNNLLNTAYYDNLSRFKYYGLLNMGRNVVLNFKTTFGGPLKGK